MTSITISQEVLTESDKLVYHPRRDYEMYEINMWQELRKRRMVLVVLGALLLAVIAPDLGAPGGSLHSEYWVPLATLLVLSGGEWGTGAREAAGGAALARGAAGVIAGGLAYAGAGNGLSLIAVSSGQPWVSVWLKGGALSAALADYLAALAAAPLLVKIVCGHIPLPALWSLCPVLLVGPARLLRGRAGAGVRGAAGGALLYADCCSHIREVGGETVYGVLADLGLVLLWILLSVVCCALVSRVLRVSGEGVSGDLLAAGLSRGDAAWFPLLWCSRLSPRPLCAALLLPAQCVMYHVIRGEDGGT